jgi:toxin ParE1/3/4
VRLEWSVFAVADREQIFSYIEADNPRAAIAVDNTIQTQIETLIAFPERGRPGRVDGTRELVIQRTPYVAAYRISGDTIRVLRVLHGAQQWPDVLSET